MGQSQSLEGSRKCTETIEFVTGRSQTNADTFPPPPYSKIQYSPSKSSTPSHATSVIPAPSAHAKLLVGPNKTEFHVPQHILAQLPPSIFPETLNHDQTIDLPNEDPETITILLHYLFTGTVNAIAFDKADPIRSSHETQQCLTNMKAYILAHKYNPEALMNALVDAFHTYFTSRFVSPLLITHLTEAGLRYCKLRRFLVRRLAVTLAAPSITPWSVYRDRDRDWEDGIRGFAGEDVLDVLRECMLVSGGGMVDTVGRCTWHMHERCGRCGRRRGFLW